MFINRSVGERIYDAANTIIIGIIIIITIYPLLHIVMASFSQGSLFIAHKGILLWPVGSPTVQAYGAVLRNPNIITGYLNTIFVVGIGTAVNILLTAVGAFFLSRKNVLFRNFVMFIIVFSMYFSGGLIPLYFTVRNLGLENTLLALVFPVAINTTNLIIMLTAFSAIPDSLTESATIDGANHITVLFRIIVPVAFPTIAVLILYYAVGHWNSWFNAMIFLRRRELFPLQLILREILIQNDTTIMTMGADAGERAFVGETIKNAIIVVATLPILLLYPFLQKYFVKGIMVGSLKG